MGFVGGSRLPDDSNGCLGMRELSHAMRDQC